MRQDYYRILQVASTASADEIRQSYRALVRRYHPDANPESPGGDEQFKLITEAYTVLTDPQQRVAYDRALAGFRRFTMSPRVQLRRETAPAPPVPSPLAGQADAGQSSAPADRESAMPDRATVGGERVPLSRALALTATPGEAAVMPPRAATYLYLLTELGAAGEQGIIDPLPLDIALVIDRSSSMQGKKLDGAKRAVLSLLDQLRPDDRLTLVFFDDHAEVIADGETIEARAGIEMGLDRIRVKGSTRLANGLAVTLDRIAARQTGTRISTLMLVTDGRTFGDDERCIELAGRARDLGVAITTFGMGIGWNRTLLDRLAALSGGTSNFVERPAEIPTIVSDALLRLRATLASHMRLTCTPGGGVRIARATRIAPEIAEAFEHEPREVGVEPGIGRVDAAAEPVTVELGTLVGRPEIDSTVVIWEVLLDPATIVATASGYALATFTATYWAPRQGRGQWERLEQSVELPVNTSGVKLPMHPDIRLALRLMNAYRLQSSADRSIEQGDGAAASALLSTSALRLNEAGAADLAQSALHAVAQLGAAEEESKTATLRVKYDVKNLSVFHRLRGRAP